MQSESTETAVPFIITATLPPTLTTHPSETFLPPPPPPTIVPVEGISSTQLNVRVEPSTASEILGIIAANTKVQIVSKDPAGNWWQILYDAGIDGKGWVTAQYVETAGKPEVPVMGGGETNRSFGKSAVVIQQLNIRSGPGTSFNSLGILNTNDVVNLTGKNRDGSWLQIDFMAGPEGKGWVNAGFVKTDEVNSLSIVSDAGEVIGTGTPANTALPPTPTLLPAPMDFDSAESPIKTVILGGVDARTVLYNGDVSTPNGDMEDWVSVTPYADVLLLGIQCFGSASIHVEGGGIKTEVRCNEALKAIPVQTGAEYLIHIEAVSNSGSLEYIKYNLTIKASP